MRTTDDMIKSRDDAMSSLNDMLSELPFRPKAVYDPYSDVIEVLLENKSYTRKNIAAGVDVMLSDDGSVIGVVLTGVKKLIASGC